MVTESKELSQSNCDLLKIKKKKITNLDCQSFSDLTTLTSCRSLILATVSLYTIYF